jgi:hypothetical protein
VIVTVLVEVNGVSANPYTAERGTSLPSTVRAVRVLLFITAGLTVASALSAWLMVGGAYALGSATLTVLPGVASGLAGRATVRKPTRLLWFLIIAWVVRRPGRRPAGRLSTARGRDTEGGLAGSHVRTRPNSSSGGEEAGWTSRCSATG